MHGKKLTLILLIASVAVLFSMTGVSAQTQDKNSDVCAVTPNPKSSALRLTSEQREKMSAIRGRYEMKVDEIQFEMRKRHIELADEMRKPEPNRKAINKKIDQIMKLEKKRLQIVLDEFFEVRSVLRPEQNRYYINRMIRLMMRDL